MVASRDSGWEACAEGDCRGVRLATGDKCWAHADDVDLDVALNRLGMEGILQASGAVITSALLVRMLAAAPRDAEGLPRLVARFDGAIFEKGADFGKVTFEGPVNFEGAIFQGEARFGHTTFQGEARFSHAIFQGETSFKRATFEDGARFGKATFSGAVDFTHVTFERLAVFTGAIFEAEAIFEAAHFKDWVDFDKKATFKGDARFARTTFENRAGYSNAVFESRAGWSLATFKSEVRFDGAVFRRWAKFRYTIFETAPQLGPLLVMKKFDLDGAVFRERVQIEVAAAALCARRVRFPAGVRFRLRWASVVLDDADLAAPSSLAGVPPFPDLDEQEAARRWQRLLPGPRRQRWRPRLLSLCRADVAGLRLNNVDLRACRFNGTHNLDRLRIEGEPLFARTCGWWRTRRKTLAEEQQWRASRTGRWRPGGWYPRACQPPASMTVVDSHALLAPVQLAALYRELRKGREDAKDEPGAADFYYGEMELRRHDTGAPLAERLVLWLYWLVSGYGLRGLRALAWLGVVILGLAALLQSVGFNGGDPPFRDALIYAAQSTVSIASGNKTLTDHLSWAGEVLRIILRLVGPLLLGLALLAIRNRVKR
jgi:uncharacterized protein YjbI with pentapeptide repeats